MKLPLLQAFLRDSASAMHTGPANPIDANFVRWPVLSAPIYPNVVALGTYDLEFAYLTDWLTTRASWLDAHWTTGF